MRVCLTRARYQSLDSCWFSTLQIFPSSWSLSLLRSSSSSSLDEDSFSSSALTTRQTEMSDRKWARGQGSEGGHVTHTACEERRPPRLDFFPMTGVPKCSGLVSGSWSSVWPMTAERGWVT